MSLSCGKIEANIESSNVCTKKKKSTRMLRELFQSNNLCSVCGHGQSRTTAVMISQRLLTTTSVPEAVGIDPDPLLGEMFLSERSSTLDKWFATKYGFVFLIRFRGISENFLAEGRGHITLSDRAFSGNYNYNLQ